MDTSAAIFEGDGRGSRLGMNVESGSLERDGRAGKVEAEANENGGRHLESEGRSLKVEGKSGGRGE